MGEDEVDLLVIDAVLLGHGDGDEEDAEDIVAVSLEGGSRLILVLRWREQPFERGLLELTRSLRAQLLGTRVEQVDPGRGHRGANSPSSSRSLRLRSLSHRLGFGPRGG